MKQLKIFKQSVKGYSLPINTVTVVVLAIAFIAIFFALVSGVVNQEVDKLITIAEKNTPELSTGSGG